MGDEVTFEQQVNTVIGEVTKSDDGKLVFPDGTSEAVAFAAKTEMRRRDTQSAFTKEQEKALTLAAENNKLAESWAADFVGTLTPSQQAELKELKHTDPDAWRRKLGAYEAGNKEAFETKKQEVKQAAKKETELQRRERVLEEYNTAHPNAKITNEVIANELPPRIMKRFEAGEIDFDGFLAEASKYLTAGKVVVNTGEEAPDNYDLSKMGGNSKPTSTAVAQDITKSYDNEIY